mgnify:CR=1 FL=1
MLTAENKNKLDGLLAFHEMTSHLLNPTVSDVAMLATVVQMARDGKDEMALYVLHNIKPYGLELAEKVEEKEDEPEIDLDLGDLLRFLLS